MTLTTMIQARAYFHNTGKNRSCQQANKLCLWEICTITYLKDLTGAAQQEVPPTGFAMPDPLINDQLAS